MSDAHHLEHPLEALGGPDPRVEPRAEFRRTLRRRLERAVDLPPGVTVSGLLRDVTEEDHQADDQEVIVMEHVSALTPYIAVADSRAAAGSYAAVFGAELVGQPVVMPDGRIGHCELSLPGGARLYMADAHPEIGVVAPDPRNGTPVTLHLEVDDVDVVYRRATDSSFRSDRAPQDTPYGRQAVVYDPSGHRWMLMGPVAAPSPQASAPVKAAEVPAQVGQVVYSSLWAPDPDATARELRDLLGWPAEQDRQAGAGDAADPEVVHRRRLQFEGLSRPQGMAGPIEPATLLVCLVSDDLEAARELIVSSGGVAEPATDEPYGRVALCRDPQGGPFALLEDTSARRGIAAASPPPVNGDLVYVTMVSPDSQVLKDFYVGLFGWTASAGRTPGGWNLETSSMSMGIGPGDERVNLGMYACSDLDRAVAAVRAAGGVADDPSTQPYGRSSVVELPSRVRLYLLEI